jgi:hypothetical protein
MNKTYDVVHTVKLVTKFNMEHPTTKAVISMAPEQVQEMCRKAFIDMATKEGWLTDANYNGGSFAYLEFAEDGE